jgi:DNA-binding NtrC family response regulator
LTFESLRLYLRRSPRSELTISNVLLSDQNIGKDGDGFAVVRAMRKAHPHCVTILLTGYPAFESALQAIHDEVDDYFVKPADLDSLISTIERKLGTRQGRS